MNLCYRYRHRLHHLPLRGLGGCLMGCLLSCLLCFLLGCTNISDEYCRRPCYVLIDNQLHNDATLASAMNPMAPGTFCTIQEKTQGGATYFNCHNNQGQESDIKWTAVYDRMTIIVGLNNGIIVGFGNLDSPAVFYAYDRECPNCFDPDGIPVRSRPLTTNEKGHATCGVCHRTYDLNNRGFIASGEPGKPLTRFPASTTGPYGVLSVR